jgi:hypothetical protein
VAPARTSAGRDSVLATSPPGYAFQFLTERRHPAIDEPYHPTANGQKDCYLPALTAAGRSVGK